MKKKKKKEKKKKNTIGKCPNILYEKKNIVYTVILLESQIGIVLNSMWLILFRKTLHCQLQCKTFD